MKLRHLVFVSLALVLILVASGTRVLALQTGAISGKVTDAVTGAPVANAKVAAVAPTSNTVALTSATGAYSMIGLPPDTYVITMSKNGYEVHTEIGVTVQPGVNQKIDVRLQPSTKMLGRVAVRSTRGTLVQPDITTDAYSVGVTQQNTLKGTPLSSEQFGLLTELPGVSSAGGYPILRGGLENNEGYQIEGITVTDPFFSQFANNDTFNGAQSIKVVLGPGDATQGGAGSGYINSVVKRGAYPAFGVVQTEFGVRTRQNNLNFEYGNATPDNRFSYFLSGRYQPNMAQGGAQGVNGGGPYKPDQVVQGLPLNDQLGALSYTVAADTVANLYYKFAGNEADQVQLFAESGLQNYVGNYGLGIWQTPYWANFPFYQQFYPGVAPSQLPVLPGQATNNPYPQVPGQIQTYQLLKLAFSRAFDPTTFLSARLYQLSGNTNFNLTEANYPYLSLGFPSLFNDFYEGTPFQTTGAAFDLQKQAGDKNFVSLGYEYKFSKGSLLIGFPASVTFAFLPNEQADFSAGPPAGVFAGTSVRMPFPEYGTLDPEYGTSAYINDQWKPTNNITIQPGLRYETQRIHMPAGLYDVHSLAPKFGVTYALNANNVVRASYGHSTVFAPLGQVETIYQAPLGFKNYPATASICGTFGDFTHPCANYYEQILADEANSIGISPAAFPGPQGSDSYDLSIEHEFAHSVSMKLTGWYRRDYSVVVNEALPIFINGSSINGPQTVTNDGFGSSTGVDLGVSRQIVEGLSGQLNLTYINQFINYLSANAFVPTVLPSTLATVVHPPYLTPFNATLALDYNHSGWRINPILNYSHGTPQGFPQSYYVKINGVYQAVPNTNYFGNPNDPCYFVDSQVPGSAAAPNVVGSLGGGCAKARNGTLSKANIFGQITVSKDITRKSTAGITVYNLFNNQVQGLYNNLAGSTGAYVNNGFGAYGAGSGFSQYGGGFIAGAPAAFPSGPFFNTESSSGLSGIFFINIRI